MEEKFRILSLDGGGTWAIIQLLTLREYYGGEAKGHNILQEYDLVIANSGGSIVLAALCCNWSLQETLALFEEPDNVKQIFYRNRLYASYFPAFLSNILGVGPKYSARKKHEAFKKFFPSLVNQPMKALPDTIGKPSLKLIVCTYDAIHNRAKFFRSYPSYDGQYDSVDLVEAIHGSSNAPVNYFDFPAEISVQKNGAPQVRNFYAWDGALGGFNNPIAAGLIEAMNLGQALDTISLISLGTYNKTMSQALRTRFKGWIYGLKKFPRSPLAIKNFLVATTSNLAKSILYVPPDWANYVAYVLRFNHKLARAHNKGNMEQFVRMSPLIHLQPKYMKVRNGRGAPSDVEQLINNLYKLDMDLRQKKDIQLVIDCFEAWKKGEILNQPIRGSFKDNNELIHEIGHATFAEAMAAWKGMMW